MPRKANLALHEPERVIVVIIMIMAISIVIMIMMQAKPSMTKSSVVDNETGKSMDSTVRTSTGTFFARGQDEVLAAVEKRIAQVCTCKHRCHAAAVSVDFAMCDILSLSVAW